MVSFIGIFLYILSPSFGNGRNGLMFADDMFNSLSKGSAYFIKDELKKAERQVGTGIDVNIKAADRDSAQIWNKLFSTSGASVKVDGTNVSIKGDLGKIMKSTLEDCDSLYYNNGNKVVSKYGYEARQTMYAWNNAYKRIDRELKNQQKFKEAGAVSSVTMKAIEPAYNFYNIEIKYVKDNIPTVTFMLVFYVIYTLWFGFAIYYLCDGIGISTSKAAKKSEA